MIITDFYSILSRHVLKKGQQIQQEYTQTE